MRLVFVVFGAQVTFPFAFAFHFRVELQYSILGSFNLHEWVDRIVCVSSFYFGVDQGTRR